MGDSWWHKEAAQRLKAFQAFQVAEEEAQQPTGTDTGTIPIPAVCPNPHPWSPGTVLRVIRGGMAGVLPYGLLGMLRSPVTITFLATVAAVPTTTKDWELATAPPPPPAAVIIHHRHRRHWHQWRYEPGNTGVPPMLQQYQRPGTGKVTRSRPRTDEPSPVPSPVASPTTAPTPTPSVTISSSPTATPVAS